MAEHESDIGALWIKDGKSSRFMTGKVTVDGKEESIIVFRNTHKEGGSKQPDYRIYKQRPREESREAPDNNSRKPVDKDDIPF